ncbi:hypothetical protein [Bacillus toyonensis]|uniref:hypothetical protein n=1 Tax=Bacillus toyonensis TaxID=155322 RepID=UPI0015CF666B|nr:hypothetical protein [Bacillus toyonensis]
MNRYQRSGCPMLQYMLILPKRFRIFGKQNKNKHVINVLLEDAFMFLHIIWLKKP